MDSLPERLVIAAAAERDAAALDAWLGALNLNWPGHPPVLVYDLGLARSARAALERLGVAFRTVPAFCAHWQRHHTWKLWSLADAPARQFLWMNIGLITLAPLAATFDAIERQGIFIMTNGELCDWEASEAACRGCGVPPYFRRGKPALSDALVGFDGDRTRSMRAAALAVALVEEHIAPSSVTHRDAPAILSLLVHRDLPGVTLTPDVPLLASLSPAEHPEQKVWEHGGRLRPEDLRHFTAYRASAGLPYHPASVQTTARARALRELYRAHWYFGRGQLEEAAGRVIAAWHHDPALGEEPIALARALRGYEAKLRPYGDVPRGFATWALGPLERAAGPRMAGVLRSALVFVPAG